jgi:hypothetical protein
MGVPLRRRVARDRCRGNRGYLGNTPMRLACLFLARLLFKVARHALAAANAILRDDRGR